MYKTTFKNLLFLSGFLFSTPCWSMNLGANLAAQAIHFQNLNATFEQKMKDLQQSLEKNMGQLRDGAIDLGGFLQRFGLYTPRIPDEEKSWLDHFKDKQFFSFDVGKKVEDLLAFFEQDQEKVPVVLDVYGRDLVQFTAFWLGFYIDYLMYKNFVLYYQGRLFDQWDKKKKEITEFFIQDLSNHDLSDDERVARFGEQLARIVVVPEKFDRRAMSIFLKNALTRGIYEFIESLALSKQDRESFAVSSLHQVVDLATKIENLDWWQRAAARDNFVLHVSISKLLEPFIRNIMYQQSHRSFPKALIDSVVFGLDGVLQFLSPYLFNFAIKKTNEMPWLSKSFSALKGVAQHQLFKAGKFSFEWYRIVKGMHGLFQEKIELDCKKNAAMLYELADGLSCTIPEKSDASNKTLRAFFEKTSEVGFGNFFYWKDSVKSYTSLMIQMVVLLPAISVAVAEAYKIGKSSHDGV